MSPPRQAVRSYLGVAYPGATVTPLAGDASTRSFYRLHEAGGRSLVVMDYGEPFRGDTDDMRLTRIFRQAGLPVPAIRRHSEKAGCLLLEDLGDRTLEQAMGEAGPASDRTRSLLLAASRLAADVAERGTPALAASDRAAGPTLDTARFCHEMDFFVEHFAEGFLGRTVPGDVRVGLHALAGDAARSPRLVLCHRDFHARNLMLTDDHGLTMVDIQDARWGPDTYDLASLLYDAYTKYEEKWIDELLDAYLARLDDPPPRSEFHERLTRVATQRMIKALGTFGFQIVVRRNERYRPAVTRTMQRLRAHLQTTTDTERLQGLLTGAGLL